MGPIILFDKSTLESLTIDETVWLDAFYSPVITPLFFVETLADLEKKVQEGRTPEQVVGNLSEKTPDQGTPNVHHTRISESELLGYPVEMRRVPVVGGGEPVASGGRTGVVIKHPPEMEALRRWKRGQFLEVEREFAKEWRSALSGIDLQATFREGRAIIDRVGRPKDLVETRAMAIALLNKPGSRYTRDGLRAMAVPAEVRQEIEARWKPHDAGPISKFAPYTAHVLTVDLFFTIGLGADLIGRERPTNKIDMAYLYYLPFCMVFTSGDNLHARTAPVFLSQDQVFITRQELKADLARLDKHYSELPDDVKQRGVMSFAVYPPTEGDFLVSRLWDKLMHPKWRERAANPSIKMSKEEEKALIAEIEQLAKSPARGQGQPSVEEPDAMIVEKKVPVRKGKWRLVPPEVDKSAE